MIDTTDFRPHGDLTVREQLVREVLDRRRQAHAVLESLMASKSECERQLAQFRRHDAFKTVTGNSAIERAIESTRDMIRVLDERLSEFGCEVVVGSCELVGADA